MQNDPRVCQKRSYLSKDWKRKENKETKGVTNLIKIILNWFLYI